MPKLFHMSTEAPEIYYIIATCFAFHSMQLFPPESHLVGYVLLNLDTHLSGSFQRPQN